jgi:ISXO2-like transposase domain
MTDEGAQYTQVGKEFANYGRVDHSREEYAYFDRMAGTSISVNAAEGYFSIFKRGMTGVYQHCGEQHHFLLGLESLPDAWKIFQGLT